MCFKAGPRGVVGAAVEDVDLAAEVGCRSGGGWVAKGWISEGLSVAKLVAEASGEMVVVEETGESGVEFGGDREVDLESEEDEAEEASEETLVRDSAREIWGSRSGASMRRREVDGAAIVGDQLGASEAGGKRRRSVRRFVSCWAVWLQLV